MKYLILFILGLLGITCCVLHQNNDPNFPHLLKVTLFISVIFGFKSLEEKAQEHKE